jgi:hypothetical protein
MARHWTEQTDKEADEMYAKLSTPEIRKYQSLCDQQMRLAAEQGKDDALADLAKMSDALMRAMLARC